ncbi:NAD(P)H-dependent glycerol-3-phosphate dehydrogenase [Oceanibacterium hippocampi]|uniref:Glycerol-3-phosphate dehydrogenase [NAD(P)+] n=1 Tax=Oceanibacterium hippocampi TaxID=745714 RepID=A0A1Y5RE52_9PROT|nr:NAD(P)H-dependent glycerol-3-phosphate dehydrogenase [Oceanibacterium hippocampi]SLN15327.1 Glycerol-3-phosphate dehydrogenase [NAD(P)+] [Oceanibacterium hippocampi]
MRHIAIIGSGAWGTALAALAARDGRTVTLWSRDPALARSIADERRNPRYLRDLELPASVRATANLAEAASADALLLVVPAQALRALAGTLGPLLPSGRPLVICAKGIERDSGLLMSEVLGETLPGQPLAVLSGPNFASEIARDLPAATTLACADPALGRALVEAIGRPTFRPYLSPDPVGAQICGAAKNVLAIACGIVSGSTLGENARAALITRGMAEIARLNVAKGGRAETLLGLSGIGDVVLSCGSESSRNFALGRALGGGASLEAALAGGTGIAEGVATAGAIAALAVRTGLDMPIATAVDAIVNGGADIGDVMRALMARPFRDEHLAGFAGS